MQMKCRLKEQFKKIAFLPSIIKTFIHESGNLLRRLGFLFALTMMVGVVDLLTSSHVGWVRNSGIFFNFVLAGVLGWYLMAMARIYLWKPYEERHKRQAPRLFVNLFNIWILFIIIALLTTVVLDRDFGAIFAGLSFLGAGVALALQTPILDTFSGGVIDIEQPIKLNDWISIDGIQGKVIDMKWRSTVIQTPTGDYVYIPNAKFSTNTVINYSQPVPAYLDHVTITLGAEIPLDRGQRILVSAALSVPEVRSSGKAVAFAYEAPPVGFNWVLRFHTPSFGQAPATKHKVLQAVAEHLEKYGMEMSSHNAKYYLAPSSELPKAFVEERTVENSLISVPLFNDLNSDQREKLCDAIVEHVIDEENDIMVEGKSGDSMFILEEGSVEVLVKAKGNKEPIQVAVLGPGSYIGEMALLTGEKRSATVRALTSLRLFEIKKEHLAPLFKENPELMEKIAAAVLVRHEATKEKKNSAKIKHEARKNHSKSLLEKMRTFFAIDG